MSDHIRAQADAVATALHNADAMLDCLQSWANAGWIRWLDVGLARFLNEEASTHGEPLSPLLLLAVALCSHQNGHGHLCLDLAHCLSEPDRALLLPPEHGAQAPVVTPAMLLARIDIRRWMAACDDSRVCQSLSDHQQASLSAETPLVLVAQAQNARLYLMRLWRYETQLRQAVQQRTATILPVNDDVLRTALQQVFPSQHNPAYAQAADPLLRCDWQKIACALATRRQMAIITGGPGTGKTTTVIKLLYVLQQLQGDASPLRIKLAAPTGKAAARLSASIQQQLALLPDSHGIPHDVSTVHRLLGPVRNSRFFRHDQANPLPADVVVIDEASMVDVELMAQLMDALPAHARLILLGDKDQLASVEAGAILGSLCARANLGAYNPDTVAWVARVCDQHIPDKLHERSLPYPGRTLDQAIVMLRYSHRFGQIPGIGHLASAINAGDDSVMQLFDGRYPELQSLMLSQTSDARFDALVCDRQHGFGAWLEKIKHLPPLDAGSAAIDAWARDVLQTHAGFQVLAAVRKGEFGVDALNLHIRSVLSTHGLIQASAVHMEGRNDDADWYAGRPVMVVQNDYHLGLMNGDMGIALPCPDPRRPGQTRLLVAFEDSSSANGIRWVLPSRLQKVETVFAMTVHKSQGSEFRHTALVLPPVDSPILTRELVYTGVTRASQQFTLIASKPSVLLAAIAARVFRAGGLEEALA